MLYGHSYAPAVPVFQLMVVVAGLSLGESVLGALLSTTDRQHARTALAVMQVVLAVVLGVPLISRFGLQGALATHAISRLGATAAMYLWVARAHACAVPVGALARLLLAAGVAAGVSVPIVVAMRTFTAHLLAAGVYSVLLVYATVPLRCWTKGDYRALARRLEGAPASLRFGLRFLNARLSQP